jgi:hypothetical protein
MTLALLMIDEYLSRVYPELGREEPSDLEKELEEKRKNCTPCEPDKHEYIETNDPNGQYPCRICGRLKAPDLSNY